MRPIHKFLLVACLMVTHLGAAQSTPEQGPPPTSKLGPSPGPSAFVQAVGTSSNMGVVAAYAVNLGYDFTKRIGGDVGLPLYTTRTPYSLVNDKDWRYTTILGAPYLDLRYTRKLSDANFISILTVSGGTHSVRTYSTGRAIVDWYNHFDLPREMKAVPAIFTPFVNFGAATGTFDRVVLASPYNIARPYQNLGFLGDGEVGGTIGFLKRFKLGGSAYALIPIGPQKVFSRLVAPDSLLGGDATHGRYWNAFYETGAAAFGGPGFGGGPSKIARDNGYSGWFEIGRIRNLKIQLAYTQSVHYDYGTALVMINYDLTGLFRNLTIGE